MSYRYIWKCGHSASSGVCNVRRFRKRRLFGIRETTPLKRQSKRAYGLYFIKAFSGTQASFLKRITHTFLWHFLHSNNATQDKFPSPIFSIYFTSVFSGSAKMFPYQMAIVLVNGHMKNHKSVMKRRKKYCNLANTVAWDFDTPKISTVNQNNGFLANFIYIDRYFQV